MDKELSRAKIAELVERFGANLDAYKNSSYNETQLRREFIDPFFEALGWDVANREGYAEQYKDVVHEDSLRVGVSLKAPDYSFRIGGQRKFFLEAKKPSVSIKEDVNPAYQLRCYAWSAKLPISILTDFEEFAVYECRHRPNAKDKPSTGRVQYFTFNEYLENFDILYDTFSKEAVLKGSFDRFITSKVGKKGTAEVDGEFLKEIESWRDALAKNLALRNPDLSVEELNFAVQQTIDRIVFLRICEDRGIENYGRLQALLNGRNVYERLFHLFYQADDKYNSGLFDFKADALSHALKIDDEVIKEIIENLYHPKSPYKFSVLSADILGSVYERFLGKVIRLTAAHQAKVEEKPEVKKAGGVFYTPAYIVAYIVKNTVGALLEGQTPREAAKIKILDPACGSGSFLLGAYQCLLDWHAQWYAQNSPAQYAKGKSPAVYRASSVEGEGGWRLTTGEKKRILLNSIYGVDIDTQAVEVTKLSLLLKVLEDENNETIGKSLKLFRERVLPNLEDNVKCGNSVIGPENSTQMGLYSSGTEADVLRPFDWADDEKGFGEIIKSGGFDVVIGNPPYVRQEMLGGMKPFLQGRYKTFSSSADLYVYFIEKGVSLLKDGGVFSYIVANKWMRASYGAALRGWVKERRIEEIVDFGDLPVFQSATTYPCIIRIRQSSPAKSFGAVNVKTLDFKDLSQYVEENRFKVDVKSLDEKGWALSTTDEASLLSKLKKIGVPLGEYVKGKIYRGVLTGLDEAFVIDKETRKRLIKEDGKSKELIRPYLRGKDVRRYSISDDERFLILIQRGWTNKKAPKGENKWEWLSRNYPAIAGHLAQFKDKAQKRYDKGDYWWELRACDYYDEFEKPKIIYLKFQVRPAFTYDNDGLYMNSAVWTFCADDKNLLAILNSKIGWFLISQYCTQIQNGYQLIFKYLQQLPIRVIDLKKPDDKAAHDKIVSLVDRMLELNKKLKSAKTPHEKEFLEREIRTADREIDSHVYKLYNLTEDEIRIVEGR